MPIMLVVCVRVCVETAATADRLWKNLIIYMKTNTVSLDYAIKK